MTTACKACGKLLTGRVHVAREGDDALFIETYACGAVRAWGSLRADGDPQLRKCGGAGSSYSLPKGAT